MIISVINLKGGSGKTTTAMALATAAARHNRNVSVLDTDPQGDATTWAGDTEDAGETLPFTVDSANIGKLKRLRKTMADDELVIIDCPPAGNVVDVACDVADFVIVPATQGAIRTEPCARNRGKPRRGRQTVRAAAAQSGKQQAGRQRGQSHPRTRRQRLRRVRTQARGHAESRRPRIS